MSLGVKLWEWLVLMTPFFAVPWIDGMVRYLTSDKERFNLAFRLGLTLLLVAAFTIPIFMPRPHRLAS